MEKSGKCKCLQTFEGTMGSMRPPNLIYTDMRITFLNLKSVKSNNLKSVKCKKVNIKKR